MCGRYTLRDAPRDASHTSWKKYWHDVQLTPRYNICPSQTAITIRAEDGEVVCDEQLKWGYQPSWSKFRPLVNAKAESLLEKPMFKGAVRHHRCLIVADGFYEPKGKSGTKNRPWYLFEFEDQRAFAMGGIFTNGGFAIITAEPNQVVAPIHERMPLLIKPDHWDNWLDPAVNDDREISSLLTPWEYRGMHSYEVSDYAKKPGNEGPECIEPAKQRPNTNASNSDE